MSLGVGLPVDVGAVSVVVSGSVAALSWSRASETSLCFWVDSGQLLQGVSQRRFPLWQTSGPGGSRTEGLSWPLTYNLKEAFSRLHGSFSVFSRVSVKSLTFPFSHQRSGCVAPLCCLQCGLSGLACEQGPQPSRTQGPRTVSHDTESGCSDLFHISSTEGCFLSRFSLVFAVDCVE